ncbi:hypothetical protein Golomagni_06341 [Golovinomyces magnicellulatus]|nr:hypothetical protein Golomagni_06341 [Golovinomyces magnicellulatus]
MSGEGPESIPTSADPRSHRPTKRRALTPVSAQAASVDALFARPDQNIRLPPSGDQLANLRGAGVPEIVTHVQGSSAGAGSGEFHVYKASRRREYERLKDMDEQVRREQDQVDFDKARADRERKDDEKTRKNRERREKMKARKAKKGKGGGGDGGQSNTPTIKANIVARNGSACDQDESQSQSQSHACCLAKLVSQPASQ